MKKIVLAIAASSLFAATSIAGDLSEPVITEVDEPEAASSSAPWLTLLLIIGAGILIASQDDNSTPAPAPEG